MGDVMVVLSKSEGHFPDINRQQNRQASFGLKYPALAWRFARSSNAVSATITRTHVKKD
jgi:hypothetical protein